MKSPSAVVRQHARRHGVAVFIIAAALLGGAGATQLEDGLMPQGEVLAALASDAGNGVDADRLRTNSSRGPQHGAGAHFVGPPV